jgi:hypothetical protein
MSGNNAIFRAIARRSARRQYRRDHDGVTRDLSDQIVRVGATPPEPKRLDHRHAEEGGVREPPVTSVRRPTRQARGASMMPKNAMLSANSTHATATRARART